MKVKHMILGMFVGMIIGLIVGIPSLIISDYKNGCAEPEMTYEQVVKKCGEPSDIHIRKYTNKDGITIFTDLTYRMGFMSWNYVFLWDGKVKNVSERVK